MTAKSNWRAILVAFSIGVVGAAQVGRIAPTIDVMRDDLDLSLTTMGWMASLVTLAPACLGLFAGYWVIKWGPRSILIAGLVILSVSVLLAGMSPSALLLLIARCLEGMGYLAIIVAAPTLISRESNTADLPRSLALWGTFFTLGLSVASILGGAISDAFGWRTWVFANFGFLVMTSIYAAIALPVDPGRIENASAHHAVERRLPQAPWLLGLAFLGLTLLSLALLTMMPTFLAETQGMSSGTAGRLTGLVALASIAGSAVYGLTTGRLTTKAILIGAACLLIISAFPTFQTGASTRVVIISATTAVFASGILIAFTFATVPRVVDDQTQIAPANGLIAQFGSVGALLGPPMVGYGVSKLGWIALSGMITLFTASFLILALGATRAVVTR